MSLEPEDRPPPMPVDARARLFALVVGSSGVVAILHGIRRHSDFALVVGIALFFPGMIVAIRTRVRPHYHVGQDDFSRRVAEMDEELSPRDQRRLLLVLLALVGMVLIVLGVQLRDSTSLAVVGAVIVVLSSLGLTRVWPR